MEGIKEAIAFITDLAVKAEKPETIEINGRTYCTKSLKRYDEADKAEPIRATTLTSLVDYIKESREELRDRMIIQVVSATKVLLYSGLLPERDRETLFEVNARLPRFEYDREYDQESFLVSMQACFAPSDEREDVTKVASNIVSTQEATFSDDGISQQVVMKTGATKKEKHGHHKSHSGAFHQRRSLPYGARHRIRLVRLSGDVPDFLSGNGHCGAGFLAG